MPDPSDTLVPAVAMNDAARITSQCWRDAVNGQQAALDHIQQELDAAAANIDPDPFNLTSAVTELMTHHMRDPGAVLRAQGEYYADMLGLWAASARRWMGGEAEAVIEPEADDRRFRDPAWRENPAYDYIKQAYLLTARLIARASDGQGVLAPKEAAKLEFFTRQWLDAVAPTNLPGTNPVVVRECANSSGRTLIDGMRNLVQDVQQGGDRFQMPLSDPDAFELGKNLATTPGKVVFQNQLFQLLQYAPTTKRVKKAPLLVVPPWINKYYILDLQQKNSKIKWWVDQGYSVFVISWVNPDAGYADTTFEDYVMSGVYAALDAVTKATGEDKVNAVGYCIGGTLLAATLARMAADGDARIQSATFLTTLIDFSEPGEIGAFIDEAQIEKLEREMKKSGYLEGHAMGSAFNMLRSNDLIWNTAINRYLLGKPPPAFDLLYWNSDCTRMPAAMHSYYLRQMYLHNRLCQPDALEVAGVKLDVSRIKIPAYFLSAEDDHIAPWQSTYRGARLFSGPVRFTLSGSGHIAGTINPPQANKYHYRMSAAKTLPGDPEKWLQKTQLVDGSWWGDWADWSADFNKDTAPPRVPGKGGLRVIEDAPGSYVKKRI